MADHDIWMAEALLGLDGFRVLEVTEMGRELVVRVETIVAVVACPRVWAAGGVPGPG